MLAYMKAMADMYQNTFRVLAPGLSSFDFVTPKSDPEMPATLQDATVAPPAPVPGLRWKNCVGE